jgi:GLPGLI family protein
MKIAFIISFTLFINTVYAQQQHTPNTHSGFVKYTYKGYTSPFSQEESVFLAYLNFNSNESMFVTGRVGMDARQNGESMTANLNSATYVAPASSEKGQMIYRNFPKKEVVYNEYKLAVFPPYIVIDNWVEMEWKLSSDTKTIAGYNVKKATTTFRGTKYTAWYTESVPLPYGPQKLFGLPGIILEMTIYDIGNSNSTYTAYEVCYPCDNNQKIEAPHEDVVKTIEEEVVFKDNFRYFFVTESNNKFKGRGKLYLDELPSERKVYEKRKLMPEKIYEWETKVTKRVLPGIDYKSLLDPNRNQKKPVPDYQFNKY